MSDLIEIEKAILRADGDRRKLAAMCSEVDGELSACKPWEPRRKGLLERKRHLVRELSEAKQRASGLRVHRKDLRVSAAPVADTGELDGLLCSVWDLVISKFLSSGVSFTNREKKTLAQLRVHVKASEARKRAWERQQAEVKAEKWKTDNGRTRVREMAVAIPEE
ncbi:MAG: hypothetical protein KKH61_20625 [Gammaproteobacteria bacterium]|nr:hypothetical protein [Gammaproteobacteria bacterium]